MRTCETDRVRLGILYVCSKKRISRPGIGAGCAGTDLTTSEVIVWVILIHADLATIFPGAAPILIHAYSAIVPPGAARIAAQKQEKSPLRRPERGVLGLAISRTYNLRRLRKSSRG